MSACAQNYVYVISENMRKKLDETALTKEQSKNLQSLVEKYPILGDVKRSKTNR